MFFKKIENHSTMKTIKHSLTPVSAETQHINGAFPSQHLVVQSKQCKHQDIV